MSLFQRVDGKMLEGLKEEQGICNEIESSSDIRLYIQEYIFQIDSILKEINISEERSSNNSANFSVKSEVNGFQENSFNNRSNSNGKLPDLSIKRFNRNPIKFQSFFDSFREAIHENYSLKSIRKFNYLRIFLRGPAVASIFGLSLTLFRMGIFGAVHEYPAMMKLGSVFKDLFNKPGYNFDDVSKNGYPSSS